MASTSYATVEDAQVYFDGRLHETAWSEATGTDRTKSLLAATRIIDTLSYKGWKHSVQLAFDADSTLQSLAQQKDPTALETVRQAESQQDLEFPRGADTVVPEAILYACYEIAYALLDGVDPDLELENLAANSHGIGSVRSSFNRNQEPLEHIINGVPSATAWKYLRPFLRDNEGVRIIRVS